MLIPIIYLIYFVNLTLGKSLSTSFSVIKSTTYYPIATTDSKRISNDEVVLNDRQGRGMSIEKDDSKMTKEEQKAVNVDPWAGYYDFIINEGSFKFWAVFQLGSAILLIYSAFAAVYYAKFNPIATDYDYYDDFFFRSNNGRSTRSARSTNFNDNQWFHLDSQTIQRIFDAITPQNNTFTANDLDY